MNERTIDRLIESIDSLTSAATELAVKIKRLTNSNPFTNGQWDEFKGRNNY